MLTPILVLSAPLGLGGHHLPWTGAVSPWGREMLGLPAHSGGSQLINPVHGRGGESLTCLPGAYSVSLTFKARIPQVPVKSTITPRVSCAGGGASSG